MPKALDSTSPATNQQISSTIPETLCGCRTLSGPIQCDAGGSWAGELRSEPRSSHTESREPLAGALGATPWHQDATFACPGQEKMAPFPSVIHRVLAWERLSLHRPGQGRSGGSLVCVPCVPVSELSFCLCSVWRDTTGHNRKLFSTWFPKWLPLLFPLRLEDLCHPRRKGR